MARVRTSTGRRYAEAAFEIALRDDTVEAWLQQLKSVGGALSDPTVTRRLEDPSVPLRQRQAALDAIFETDIMPQLANLLGLVLRRRRLELVPVIAHEFRRLYNRRAGIVEAIATSAAELDEREIDALRGRLQELAGANVELELRVDPELLGGIQIRIGDQLIDGSVRRRLERLRSRLVAGTLTP